MAKDGELLLELTKLKADLEKNEQEWQKANRAYRTAKKALGPAKVKRKKVLTELIAQRSEYDTKVAEITDDTLRNLLDASKIRPYLPGVKESGGGSSNGSIQRIRQETVKKAVVEGAHTLVTIKAAIAKKKPNAKLDGVQAYLDELVKAKELKLTGDTYSLK